MFPSGGFFVSARFVTSHANFYDARVPTGSIAERGVFESVVVANDALCREHFRLTLRVADFPHAEPGQFIQIACRSAPAAWAASDAAPRAVDWRNGTPLRALQSEFAEAGAFLCRPFSIGGLRRRADGVELEIIGRAIGPGTRFLAARGAGDRLMLHGPFGRAFEVRTGAALSILVAGGVGLPPLLWLARGLGETGRRVILVIGSTTAELLPLRLSAEPDRTGIPLPCASDPALASVGVVVTTDDGSIGLGGHATAGLSVVLERESIARDAIAVFTCGPERMMRSVAEICHRAGIECQVCLERVMGCGMGTCQSCVVAIRDGDSAGRHWELCCTQGPVFDSRRVIWEP